VERVFRSSRCCLGGRLFLDSLLPAEVSGGATGDQAGSTVIGLFIQLATEEVSVLLLRRFEDFEEAFLVGGFDDDAATSNPAELPLPSNATQSDATTIVSKDKMSLLKRERWKQ
jgi:hypothetical protein